MPFKPGDPNINRGGRPPKDKALSDELRRCLELKDVPRGKARIKRKEAISEVLTQEALKGNLTAINMILDRVEGKPVASSEIDLQGKMSLPKILLTSEFEEDEQDLD